MGKFLSVILGLAAIVLGVLGLIKWWTSFLGALKASVPAILIFGGLIAVFAGISEIKDAIASKKEEKK